MTNPWPKAPIYINSDFYHKLGLLVICVFLSLLWLRAEVHLENLTESTQNIEDQYWADVCVLRERVDSIESFLGATLQIIQ